MLGGTRLQIPAIKKAREMGYFVITCDDSVENQGHKYAHEYHNVNIFDKEAVLQLAKELKVDGIMGYLSDSAAPVVAYVAEKLGLPSHPFKSVEIVSNKDKFREFLQENNFNVPKAKGYKSYEEVLAEFHQFKLPVIVKPVDSSGSRGVSRIESINQLREKVENALRYSRAQRFIIEEFIAKEGFQVGGDGFSVNGKLVFHCFANCHFPNKNTNPINPFVPIGSSWPSNKSERILNKIRDEIQKLLTTLNLQTGVYNFDIQVDHQDNIFFLDMGVRNGGNLIPNLIELATGIDLIEFAIKASLGEDCRNLKMINPKGNWASYLINSQKSGVLRGIKINENLMRNNVIKYDLWVNIGDQVTSYTGSNQMLGTMIFKFSSMSEMLSIMDKIDSLVEVIVEDPNLKSVTKL